MQMRMFLLPAARLTCADWSGGELHRGRRVPHVHHNQRERRSLLGTRRRWTTRVRPHDTAREEEERASHSYRNRNGKTDNFGDDLGEMPPSDSVSLISHCWTTTATNTTQPQPTLPLLLRTTSPCIAGSHTPYAVSIISSVGPNPLMLALGFTHSCVLYLSGKVVCWGGNKFGQLGLGTSALSVGVRRGISHSDLVRCCSCGKLQQLHVSVSDEQSASPDHTPALVNVTATYITVGDYHTCVLSNKSDVLCWGMLTVHVLQL